LSQYVRARIVSMTDIDIDHWKFDYHNSLYYFITNADQHIYMRYGGRDANAAESYLSLESLKLALREGLRQHEAYQRGEIEPRLPADPMFPRDIPGLTKNVIRQRACVECHHIADYRAQDLEKTGHLDKVRTMFLCPDIRKIGLHLDVPKGLVLSQPTDQAADAGLQKGDRITGINGVGVFTFGDLQFEYDKIPRDASSFSLELQRDSENVQVEISLPVRWWYYDVGFRYWSIDPLVYFKAEPLSAEEKQDLDLPSASLASRVTNVDSIGTAFDFHQLKVDDVIVAVNGVEEDSVAGDAMLYIRLNVVPGTSANLTVLRGEQRIEMELKTKRQFYRKAIPSTSTSRTPKNRTPTSSTSK